MCKECGCATSSNDDEQHGPDLSSGPSAGAGQQPEHRPNLLIPAAAERLTTERDQT